LEATDKDELEKAAKELSDKIMPIGAKMYESAQADSAESEKPKAESQDEKGKSKKSDKDEPVEGEVVDDKKEE